MDKTVDSKAPASPVAAEKVSALVRIAREHRLSEMVVRVGDTRVELRLSAGVSVVTGGSVSGAPSRAEAPVVTINAPLTGLFFPRPGPTEPPFISPGDVVRVGDPIGLIEAMKVYNEVAADQAGRVRKVLPEPGQLVQQGDPLVELLPLESD